MSDDPSDDPGEQFWAGVDEPASAEDIHKAGRARIHKAGRRKPGTYRRVKYIDDGHGCVEGVPSDYDEDDYPPYGWGERDSENHGWA